DPHWMRNFATLPTIPIISARRTRSRQSLRKRTGKLSQNPANHEEGEVNDARLDPVEGSEQRGSRPVVVISRDAINESSPVVSAAPFTTYREGRRIYPSQVLVKAPEGGLEVDSVILGEQVRVLDKKRLLRRRGELTPATMARLNEALRICIRSGL